MCFYLANNIYVFDLLHYWYRFFNKCLDYLKTYFFKGMQYASKDQKRYFGHILVHPVEGQNFANTNIGIVYQIQDLIKEVMWWEDYIWLSIGFSYFMTTYKTHTCLRRLRFSYLVVLCAPSDWKSGHLYATPAVGSIKDRAGERFNSCFWWYSIWEGFIVNLKCNIP